MLALSEPVRLRLLLNDRRCASACAATVRSLCRYVAALDTQARVLCVCRMRRAVCGINKSETISIYMLFSNHAEKDV